jgi:hypothetical protein
VNRRELRESAADNWPPLVLAGIAFGGSFDHWVHLATSHGQHGVLAPAIAICVDLGVYMATRERQRDARIGRKRRGWASWPTVVLLGGIVLTLAGNVSSTLAGNARAHPKLAGNVASAHPTPWGIITALIPGAFLLVAISLMERRAAEDGRQALAAEARRQADVAAERQRQAGLATERERQETARLEAEAAADRQRERQAGLAARRAAIVNGPSIPALPGTPGQPPAAPLLALPAGAAPPPGGAPAMSATDVMRAYWDAEIGAGRPAPTGADLLRAAGVPPSSSLGRQNAAKWRAELAAAAEPEGARA